ncbi:MAG TPA: nickel-dependent lactate racemase [Pseudothermotoga sp.]|nr:nickel-dependent lactate racemase [Pseudothermotoga sp.]HPP69812.1 nickel-dependent lactate racemase [Pseudothermotoga sp.]
MTEYTLKYGEQSVSFSLPESVQIDVLFPNKELDALTDPANEIKESLRRPIGTDSLRELIAKEKPKNVVVLVSDLTRPCPSHVIVPPLIDELLNTGLREDQIKIIFGLGFHRKMTVQEMEKAVGKSVFGRIKCLNHDISECVFIGKTKRGTPIEVFKPVVESDFIIATGNLELHWFAGYSGGNKALLPGVCSKRTIETNHSYMLLDGAVSGKIENNPVREDIEEAGKMANVRFIVNAVLNSKKQIVKIVSGDPVLAHREGVKYIDMMYKVKIHKKYDIVIASPGGFPKDINLYQAQKGLDNAFHAVKDDGIIVLVAECREDFGEKTFEEWMKNAKDPNEPLEWIKREFHLGGHKAVGFCKVLKKARVFLCSKMDKKTVKQIFMTPYDSVQNAVDDALKELSQSSSVLLMPYANSTLPYLD